MVNLVAVLGLILLILAFTIASIMIVTIFMHGSLDKVHWQKTVSINSEEGLARQGLFWIMILTPTIHFIAFGILAWKGYTLALNAEGFITFTKISALPFGLLALSVPLTALIGKIHSTAQAARQIQLTQEKNKHDLFYLHRREFVQYFNDMATTIHEIEVSYKISARIHGKIFSGKPADGTPKIQPAIIDHKIMQFKYAESNLRETLVSDDTLTTRENYAAFCKEIYELIVFFSIRDLNLKLKANSVLFSHQPQSPCKQRSVGNTTDHAIVAHECVRVYLMNILAFASYDTGTRNLTKDSPDFEDLRQRYAYKQTIEEIIKNAQSY